MIVVDFHKSGDDIEISVGLVGTSVSVARNYADIDPVSCRCLDETLA